MTEPEIETGETGPDWEPTDATRYYAQYKVGAKGALHAHGRFAFGPSPEAAIAALKAGQYAS